MSWQRDVDVRVGAAEAARRVERLRRTLREAGVRLTPQRMEVFREVASRADHPDAERVFREVRRRMPAISLDTVYRTLLLLRDLGLIVALGPRRESVRFDAHLETHDHYVCLRCGMTRDIEGTAVRVEPRAKSVKCLGSVVATRVEVQGICRSCADELAGAKGQPRRRGAP